MNDGGAAGRAFRELGRPAGSARREYDTPSVRVNTAHSGNVRTFRPGREPRASADTPSTMRARPTQPPAGRRAPAGHPIIRPPTHERNSRSRHSARPGRLPWRSPTDQRRSRPCGRTRQASLRHSSLGRAPADATRPPDRRASRRRHTTRAGRIQAARSPAGEHPHGAGHEQFPRGTSPPINLPPVVRTNRGKCFLADTRQGVGPLAAPHVIGGVGFARARSVRTRAASSGARTHNRAGACAYSYCERERTLRPPMPVRTRTLRGSRAPPRAGESAGNRGF